MDADTFQCQPNGNDPLQMPQPRGFRLFQNHIEQPVSLCQQAQKGCQVPGYKIGHPDLEVGSVPKRSK